ncbi:hypothetical protein SAGO17_0061 [Mimivirus AB-566-O17]|uniref:Transmembrane protein n=1 Tax=Mimivirus AB-566-O17 TaxID=1988039 RepID=A0A1X9VNT8_9VIRU|nr:hypothetical protein SAGO17_0061 [Mimivirus AB-566-O17]
MPLDTSPPNHIVPIPLDTSPPNHTVHVVNTVPKQHCCLTTLQCLCVGVCIFILSVIIASFVYAQVN